MGPSETGALVDRSKPIVAAHHADQLDFGDVSMQRNIIALEPLAGPIGELEEDLISSVGKLHRTAALGCNAQVDALAARTQVDLCIVFVRKGYLLGYYDPHR